MQGFALACRGRDPKRGSAANQVLCSLRKYGWKEAKINDLNYMGIQPDHPEREYFLFHPDFFLQGEGEKAMKTIKKGIYDPL